MCSDAAYEGLNISRYALPPTAHHMTTATAVDVLFLEGALVELGWFFMVCTANAWHLEVRRAELPTGQKSPELISRVVRLVHQNTRIRVGIHAGTQLQAGTNGSPARMTSDRNCCGCGISAYSRKRVGHGVCLDDPRVLNLVSERLCCD